MVLLDQRPQVFQTICKMDADILTVAEHILAGRKYRLPFLGNHHIQDLHRLLPA